MIIKLSLVLLICASVYVSAKERCCPGFPKCFTDEPPYDHLPLPECQDTVQVSFHLFTRENPIRSVTMALDLPLPIVFNGNKRTVFVIHGWNSDKNGMGNIRGGLLRKEDVNLIEVDWSGGAKNIWYPQSVSDIRTTGAMVGLMGNRLIDKTEASPDKMWCVGFSLGGHSCGQAGKYVHFGKVTGLDPAGPLFENYDISTGLNPNSGDYVEVYHSAGKDGILGFNVGTLKPLGHVDFYPNGGAVQPGCINYLNRLYSGVNPKMAALSETDRQLFEADRIMAMAEVSYYFDCSHKRANDYFEESLFNDECHFFAHLECTNSRDLPGSCKSCGDKPCNELGYNSEIPVKHQGKRGLMYLETNSYAPFCQG